MKLKDIVNSQCDIRKYLSIDIPDEVKDELENWDYDVDSVLQAARIYVDADKLDEEVIPLELNDNQKIVLEWLKWSVKEQGNSVIDAVFLLRTGEALDSVLLELNSLNNQQQAEVLAAFAQWGLEHDI